MATVQIKPLQQAIAETLTVAAIDIGAKDNADKIARAIVAQSVAGILQSASTGDLTVANAAVGALIAGIADPGLRTVAQNIAGIGSAALGIEGGVVKLTPLVSDTVQGILANTAAGMQAVAAAYIAQYGAQTAK